MIQPIYMLVGSPGSGKSWVAQQLQQKYHYIAHDAFIDRPKGEYLSTIIKEARDAPKPVLIETPFSISEYKVPLEKAGLPVIPVFIIEDEKVLSERYFQREKKRIVPGHISRQRTYAQRAKQFNAFAGTSAEVLNHLLNMGDN